MRHACLSKEKKCSISKARNRQRRVSRHERLKSSGSNYRLALPVSKDKEHLTYGDCYQIVRRTCRCRERVHYTMTCLSSAAITYSRQCPLLYKYNSVYVRRPVCTTTYSPLNVAAVLHVPANDQLACVTRTNIRVAQETGAFGAVVRWDA